MLGKDKVLMDTKKSEDSIGNMKTMKSNTLKKYKAVIGGGDGNSKL